MAYNELILFLRIRNLCTNGTPISDSDWPIEIFVQKDNTSSPPMAMKSIGVSISYERVACQNKNVQCHLRVLSFFIVSKIENQCKYGILSRHLLTIMYPKFDTDIVLPYLYRFLKHSSKFCASIEQHGREGQYQSLIS